MIIDIPQNKHGQHGGESTSKWCTFGSLLHCYGVAILRLSYTSEAHVRVEDSAFDGATLWPLWAILALLTAELSSSVSALRKMEVVLARRSCSDISHSIIDRRNTSTAQHSRKVKVRKEHEITWCPFRANFKYKPLTSLTLTGYDIAAYGTIEWIIYGLIEWCPIQWHEIYNRMNYIRSERMMSNPMTWNIRSNELYTVR